MVRTARAVARNELHVPLYVLHVPPLRRIPPTRARLGNRYQNSHAPLLWPRQPPQTRARGRHVTCFWHELVNREHTFWHWSACQIRGGLQKRNLGIFLLRCEVPVSLIHKYQLAMTLGYRSLYYNWLARNSSRIDNKHAALPAPHGSHHNNHHVFPDLYPINHQPITHWEKLMITWLLNHVTELLHKHSLD